MLNEIFDQKSTQLKLLADVLKKYSSPYNSKELEDQLLLIKKNEICFDGYNLIYHFTKTNYENHVLENLQVYSKDFPILPFYVTFKFAKSFYQDIEHVSYLESEVDNIRVYCWMFLRKTKDNKVLLPVKNYSKTIDQDGVKLFYITLPFFDFLK